MSLGCLRQVRREPVQCLRPARLVQHVSSLGRERSMIENELRSVTMVRQRKRHDCLLVVGIGLFPHERIDEAPRRIDFQVVPAQVERLPSGGCIVMRYRPPSRTSSSTLGAVKPAGPHHPPVDRAPRMPQTRAPLARSEPFPDEASASKDRPSCGDYPPISAHKLGARDRHRAPVSGNVT